ncbi:MAG: undecaprenyldiphospho-muramoylpentapeptide beta-N-acetylglucosaminyltransferase, partial [Gammaproteobacteria bacterium]
LGTARGLEARLVPAAGFPLDLVPARGLRGAGAAGWLLGGARLAAAVARALGVLRRRRPQVVLGMGGYVSAPGALAARLLGLPLVIHEQNAVAGLANRLLAPLARQVLTAFPGVLGARGARLTGNPVRPEIAALPPPEARLGEGRGPTRVLVLGGSQGARALDEALPRALAGAPVTVRHQCGRGREEAVQRAYREAGVEARVQPFIEDMAEAYGWAELAVARSGALTVAELAAAGLGAVLVPYPHAVDGHQRRNAAYLEEAGAARVVEQAPGEGAPAEALGEALRGALGPLLGPAAAGRRLAMARAARALARPRAAEAVAEACLEAAGLAPAGEARG